MSKSPSALNSSNYSEKEPVQAEIASSRAPGASPIPFNEPSSIDLKYENELPSAEIDKPLTVCSQSSLRSKALPEPIERSPLLPAVSPLKEHSDAGLEREHAAS